MEVSNKYPKSCRLRKNRDFQKVYGRSKSIAGKYLVLVYKKTNKDNTRFGYSASKKYGNAVKRNKVRRRLKEIIRNQLHEIKNGYDIVFVVRKRAQEADYRMLEMAVNTLIEKANLRK